MLENEQLFPIDIPKCEEIEYTPLLAQYKRLVNIHWIIFFAILLIGGITFYFLIENLGIVWAASVLIAWGIWFALKLVLIHVGLKRKGYAVREHDIHYRSGYFTLKETSVPVKRIQHLEIRQGMISKFLGLAKLKVYTAGEANMDLSIKGISLETAEDIKALLTQKIKIHD
ncbi:MAG: PH domain-containing protein [Carboxylicivirga sp.]|jgi:membrane protein YdbS with pleckstrin-like domain|nr:PH domain-containing protein [Carboxylicivirga sp.]MCT4643432.1 PH domain-containing protein [Carboxylicivirga sp.]